jgi:hypothetical protein
MLVGKRYEEGEMQQRMAVLAAPRNRVGRITDRMTFKGKERCGVVRGGGSTTSEWKGTNRMGWRSVPGIDRDRE